MRKWFTTIAENHVIKKPFVKPLNLGKGCAENHQPAQSGLRPPACSYAASAAASTGRQAQAAAAGQ